VDLYAIKPRYKCYLTCARPLFTKNPHLSAGLPAHAPLHKNSHLNQNHESLPSSLSTNHILYVPLYVRQLTSPSAHRIYGKSRQGYVKYALQAGYALTPVYCFGENKTYSNFQVGCV